MMKPNKKKLALRRQTIAALSPSALARVVGGEIDTVGYRKLSNQEECGR